jgi:hypothetical protein
MTSTRTSSDLAKVAGTARAPLLIDVRREPAITQPKRIGTARRTRQNREREELS